MNRKSQIILDRCVDDPLACFSQNKVRQLKHTTRKDIELLFRRGLKLWIIILVFLFSSDASLVQASGVYNFYFQKNAAREKASPSSTAPTVDSQGSQLSTKPSLPSNSQKSFRVEVEQTKIAKPDTDQSNWEFRLGYTLGNSFTVCLKVDCRDDEYLEITPGGGILGVQYNLNPYIGATFDLSLLHVNKENIRSNYDKYDLFGALGVTLTPFHIEWFGLDFMDISFVGGLTTASWMNSNDDLTILPFAGMEMGFHLYKGFIAKPQLKWIFSRPKFSRNYALMLAYRF